MLGMLKKAHPFPFRLKAIGTTPGKFSGLASVYGNVDSYGDVVMPGAFTKTLREKNGRVVVLSQHDPTRSIGTAVLVDGPSGLRAEGTLELDLLDAKEDYIRLKAGLIDGISIGYETIRHQTNRQNGTRELLEVRLWEISLVTFPANELARVTDVKRGGFTFEPLAHLVTRMRSDVTRIIRNGDHR